MRALIVDDARAMRRILRHLLTSLDFEVSEASDGREGIDMLRRLPAVDLVLVDLCMPCMDGAEFVRALRSEIDHAAVPVLMITAEEDPLKIDLALRAGANGHLRKPFGRQDVLASIRELGLAPSCA